MSTLTDAPLTAKVTGFTDHADGTVTVADTLGRSFHIEDAPRLAVVDGARGVGMSLFTDGEGFDTQPKRSYVEELPGGDLLFIDSRGNGGKLRWTAEFGMTVQASGPVSLDDPRVQRWMLRQMAAVEPSFVSHVEPVTIPNVPFGPDGIDPRTADANYYESAAKSIRDQAKQGISFAGTNLTEAVARLLDNTAKALRKGTA